MEDLKAIRLQVRGPARSRMQSRIMVGPAGGEVNEVRFARRSIPDELLKAQRNDELVWFVGAGASMGSGLPDFAKLTRDIAEAAQVPVSGEELRRPDEFLGRLAADYGVPVHQRVADIIEVTRYQSPMTSTERWWVWLESPMQTHSASLRPTTTAT